MVKSSVLPLCYLYSLVSLVKFIKSKVFLEFEKMLPINNMRDADFSVGQLVVQQESVGPKGGFSYYVFEQLYARQQFSKLLRLGEEFPEELAIFLKQHCDLLWLHEVFLHQFPLASETLHRLSLSQDESSGLDAEEEAESDYRDLSLIDRKRFLNLAKIAALAGQLVCHDPLNLFCDS